MAISIPNLPVGTIGGGTSLPTQKACLDILQLHGTGKTDAFAEVCAGLCLAGDLSLIGALCANEFSKAHQNYARIGPKSSK
jgi:hydroxymethylglutaryl-CoA reductase (NADPH)